MNAHEFLRSLAIVLCTAGVTTVLFQKLRQPVVLGYLLAGLIVGPHIPIPLVADPRIIHILSAVGGPCASSICAASPARRSWRWCATRWA